ncbi:MAG: MFS transporter [Candidatus Omnitrophota bacterium]|nr:MFS transporter [Candidatus Omnitrophota bacterium]MDZ4241639.1 MFS transporter [Candidatus Omnitrophota bacterium]
MLRLFTHANNKNFVRLWFAQLIAQFGDRIHQMALVGLIAHRSPNSAVDLAKILAFTILPVFVIQPFAGVFVDRWDRRKTLFLCDILRGLLVLTIPFVFLNKDSMVPIYCVVFLIFSLSRLYVPAKMSILPDIVDEEHLLMANSLMTTTGMIAFALGASIGGFIVEAWGARNGFIINSATFFISAMLVFSIDMKFRLKLDKEKLLKTSHEMLDAIQKSFFQEMKEGFLYIVRHKEIRFIINMLFILLAAAGAIQVVGIVFIQQSFDSITRDLGVMAVVLGGGLFTGALIYGKFGKKIAWYKTIFLCLLLGGAMLIVFAYNVHAKADFLMACLLAYGFGMIVGPIFLAANTVAMHVAEEKMRGKVFSFLEIVIHLAYLLAMMVSSFLADRIERFWILMAVGVIFAVVGVVGMIRYHKGRGLAIGPG